MILGRSCPSSLGLSANLRTDLTILEQQIQDYRKTEKFPHKQSHLFVCLDLGVNESPQDVGCNGKVDEDKLCLLVKAEQGEVVPQLHCLDGIFLL